MTHKTYDSSSSRANFEGFWKHKVQRNPKKWKGQEETVTLKEYEAIQKENQRLKIEIEIVKKAIATKGGIFHIRKRTIADL